VSSLPNVHVWSDGGQAGRNPGPGAAAAILTFPGRIRVVCRPLGECTNNVAETWGAILALQSLVKPCLVTLHTDSQYVEFGIRKVLKGSFLKTNLDEWQRFADALRTGRHQIKVIHTDGHADDELNNLADAWAGYAADMQTPVDTYFTDIASAVSCAPKNRAKGKNITRDKGYKGRRGYR
jgi:ribonuclease HI